MRFFRQVLAGMLLVCASSACATAASRTTEPSPRAVEIVEQANKALLRRYFDEVWNGKRVEVIDELVAPDLVVHAGDGSVTRGSQQLRDAVPRLWTVFPDLHLTVEEMVADHDRVAVRLRASGTQRRALWGIEPTGRRLAIAEWFFYRLADGKIAEYWYLRDHAEARRQLQPQ